MAIIIKNVILYDPWQSVCGFVQFRTGVGTEIKIRQNLTEKDLLLSVSAGMKNHVFALSGKNQTFEISRTIDLAGEVIVCIIQKNANKILTLASGAINLRDNKIFQNLDGELLVDGFGPAKMAKNPPAQDICDTPREIMQSGETVHGSSDDYISHDANSNQEPDTAPEKFTPSENFAPQASVALQANSPKNLPHMENFTPPRRAKKSGLGEILDETEILPLDRTAAPAEGTPKKSDEAREIDELLRTVCRVDDEGRGICEGCPYREHFFGENFTPPPERGLLRTV